MEITNVKMIGKSGFGQPRGTVTIADHTISICRDKDYMYWVAENMDVDLYEIAVIDQNGIICISAYGESPDDHEEKIKELVSLLDDYGMDTDGVMRGLSKERMLEAVNILVTWALDKKRKG